MEPKKGLEFVADAPPPFRGLAVVFDLADFSRFLNEPGAQEYVPLFLNHILRALEVCITGERPYWHKTNPNVRFEPVPEPIHRKFLGDGALYIWKMPNDISLANTLTTFFVNRLFNIHNHFDKILTRVLDDVPVVNLPSGLRFGIAAGTMFELSRSDNSTEYIGFPINLASKLQGYCKDLGFLASAHLGMPKDLMKEHGYQRVVATQIPGFSKQLVIVDKEEFAGLATEVRSQLFSEPLE